MKTVALRSLAAALLLALGGVASAGTITIGTATGVANNPVASGTNPAVLPVTYAAAAGDTTAGFQVQYTWTDPNLSAAVAGANSGVCSVNNMTRIITVIYSDASNNPIVGTFAVCNVTFTVAANSAPAVVALTSSLTGSNGCFDGSAAATVCTAPNGSIDIAAVSSPTVTYAPTAAAGVAFPAGGTGTSNTQTITATPSGGTAGQTTTVGSCAVTGAGFALVGTPALSFPTGSVTPGQIQVSYTYGPAAGTGTLTCVQTSSVSGPSNVVWNLTAPVGGATPPTISYAPAPGGTITLIGTVGSTQTSNIVVTRTSNGQVGSSVTLNGQNAPAGFTITGFPAAFPGGSATPASANLGVSCVIGAATTNATLTFNEVTSTGVPPDSTTARTYNLVCQAPSPEVSPAPAPGNIAVQGAPSTTQTTQVAFANTGLADLTLACTVTGAGFTLTTAPTSPVLPGATGTAVVSVALPPAQGTTITGTLVCTTNDADEPTLTYNISGTAVNLVVPTMSAWGKALMAALLAGLGLLGFTMMRRRTV
ncbi:MAG TPA: hypothetical protein PLE37_10495 [Pseudomonadota bacterium]|nr:hypothetical protein [Pseudomonadota bacterium]